MPLRSPPSSVCTRCGEYTYALEAMGTACGNTVNGKRCKGTRRSANNVGDWAECKSCGGSGEVGGSSALCDGTARWYKGGRCRAVKTAVFLGFLSARAPPLGDANTSVHHYS